MQHAAMLLVLLVLLCPVAAKAAPGDLQVMKFDPQEIGLPDFEQARKQMKAKKSELRQLTRQQERARRKLPRLRTQARDAQRLAIQAERAYQRAESAAAKYNRKLEQTTLRYINSASTLMTAQTMGEDQIDLAQLAGDDLAVQDMVLVYGQSELLMRQAEEQMTEIRDLSRKAATAQEQAIAQRESAADAQAHADEQLRREQELLQALATRRDSSLREIRRQNQLISKALGVMLGANADLPGFDMSVADMQPGQRIAALALREYQKGVEEIPLGSNDSPDIARYRTATEGSGVGPWCAYFTSYIARRAGFPIGPGGSGLGYVPTINSWSRSAGRFFSGRGKVKPEAGDLVLWPQHIGIVLRADGDRLITIEGNSSHRIMRRVRELSSTSGFVRPYGNKIKDNSQVGGQDPVQTPEDSD